MLETLDGKPVTRVPHRADFDALIARLGAPTAEAIHDYLDSVIDNLPVRDNGLRTFGSSQLGHDLTPWPEPLDRIYHHAWEFLGDDARGTTCSYRRPCGSVCSSGSGSWSATSRGCSTIQT